MRVGWVVLGIGILLAGGCALPGGKERGEDAERFQTKLREETERFLAEHPAPMTLSNALAIARVRTLKLTHAELTARLADLTQSMTFSVFLPKVNVSYGRFGTADPLETVLMGRPIRLTDQYVTQVSLTATQPIFTPQAWLLYAEARHLNRQAALQLERAREMLDAQVAALFYQAAVAEERIRMVEAQVAASTALAEQLKAQTSRGYALEADLARIEARVALAEFELTRAKDARDMTRIRLCEILRLWPDPRLRLEGDSMTAVLERDWAFRDAEGKPAPLPAAEARALPLEELMFQTLLCRKELWSSDQLCAFSKVLVLQALAGFLPNVYGGLAGAKNPHAKLFSETVWGGGIAAVLSVFDGFSTVNAYRMARLGRKVEQRIREERASALLTGTYEAYRNWRRSTVQKEVAERLLKACELDYATAKARFDKDQETASQVLDKLSALEQARVNAVSAAYATALTEIILRDAVGIGLGTGAPGKQEKK